MYNAGVGVELGGEEMKIKQRKEIRTGPIKKRT